jgi:hypothetical protein
MDGFIRVNNSLISLDRLLVIHHKPARDGAPFRRAEHYVAVFDTGKELWLCPEDGKELVSIMEYGKSSHPAA